MSLLPPSDEPDRVSAEDDPDGEAADVEQGRLDHGQSTYPHIWRMSLFAAARSSGERCRIWSTLTSIWSIVISLDGGPLPWMMTRADDVGATMYIAPETATAAQFTGGTWRWPPREGAARSSPNRPGCRTGTGVPGAGSTCRRSTR